MNNQALREAGTAIPLCIVNLIAATSLLGSIRRHFSWVLFFSELLIALAVQAAVYYLCAVGRGARQGFYLRTLRYPLVNAMTLSLANVILSFGAAVILELNF